MSKQDNNKRSDRIWSLLLEIFSVLAAFLLAYYFLTPEPSAQNTTVNNYTTITKVSPAVLSILQWIGIGVVSIIVLKLLSALADALDIFDIFDWF